MNAARLWYRTRQFWSYLGVQAPPPDLEEVRLVLAPKQVALFTRLQAGEQAHSFQVYRKLVEQGEREPDLLAAALLHDAGKNRFPLKLWERVWIVLGKAFFPEVVRLWGQSWKEAQGPPRGLRRAFVIAEQHPNWGARMAAGAGASERVVALIHRHQDRLPTGTGQALSEEDRLLEKLQSVDDES